MLLNFGQNNQLSQFGRAAGYLSVRFRYDLKPLILEHYSELSNCLDTLQQFVFSGDFRCCRCRHRKSCQRDNRRIVLRCKSCDKHHYLRSETPLKGVKAKDIPKYFKGYCFWQKSKKSKYSTNLIQQQSLFDRCIQPEQLSKLCGVSLKEAHKMRRLYQKYDRTFWGRLRVNTAYMEKIKRLERQ